MLVTELTRLDFWDLHFGIHATILCIAVHGDHDTNCSLLHLIFINSHVCGRVMSSLCVCVDVCV